MEPEFIEVDVHVPRTPAAMWTIVERPELYSRFVRGITWGERLTASRGRGARYRYLAGGEDVVEILTHRRNEQLAWSSVQAGHHRLSVTLRPVPGGCAVTVWLAVLGAPAPDPAAIRRRIAEAIEAVSDHLGGVPAKDRLAPPPSLLEIGRSLIKAGVLTPAQPAGMLRQLKAVSRWGPTLAGGFESGARRAADSLALCDERSGRRFGELDERTTRLATAFRRYGVGEGSRILLMCRNHNAMVEAMIAGGKLGADVVLMNTGLALRTVAGFADRHGCTLVLADDEFAGLGRHLPSPVPLIRTWSSGAEPGPTSEELIQATPAERITPPKSQGRIVVLTSGTSGPP